MSSQTPTLALFRMVLLTLLAFGLCMQSTYAATCAIDDAGAVSGNEAGAAVITPSVDDSSSADDCCSSLVCSNCCLHTAGSLHSTSISLTSVMPILPVSQRVDEFRPRDYPVDIRPPIAR